MVIMYMRTKMRNQSVLMKTLSKLQHVFAFYFSLYTWWILHFHILHTSSVEVGKFLTENCHPSTFN